LGKAPGIIAPCNIPRPNPAGPVLFAREIEACRKKIPTQTASRRKEKIRLRTF
jgi:hypothetical protein